MKWMIGAISVDEVTTIRSTANSAILQYAAPFASHDL